MNLNKEDIYKVLHTESAEEIDLSIGNYYIKKCQMPQDIIYPFYLAASEVINSYIANIFNIMHPKYQIIMPYPNDENEVWVIIDNLNKYGIFKTGRRLGVSETNASSLYEIWSYLEYLFKNTSLYKQIPYLMNDLVKTYIMDIFIGNFDRSSNNWGLIFNEDKTQVKFAIFDNEILFFPIPHNISTMVFGKDWLNAKNDVKYTNKYKELVQKDLMNFLVESSQEYIKMFEDYLNLLTPKYFINLLTLIERQEKILICGSSIPLVIPDKEELITDYTENYYLIQDTFRAFKHRKIK